MKDDLAQKLLANIMKWDSVDLTKERFRIQLFANLKYDDYQKYSQGMRYVESLALWLKNFDPEDRETLYNFIKEKLIFISEEQMHNLVETAYPLYIVPILIKKAKTSTINGERCITKNRNSFKEIVDNTCFLGLSDGSHIDIFRRANHELSNENISVYYDLSEKRIKKMFESSNGEHNDKTVFLLDDFSGSGISFIRRENDEWEGKTVKFMDRLKSSGIFVHNIDIFILLYVSTRNAINYINDQLKIFAKEKGIRKNLSAVSIQIIKPIEVSDDFDTLLKKYYDKYSMNVIKDNHFNKGNTKKPYTGFDGGKLPLVLYHNTPNNSFPVIWFEKDDISLKFRGLFPRVTRHKGEL